jgi:DNA-binding NarL/FixJ family response regulator
MIRVLIVDDQEMIRAGLRVIIDAHPDLQVVAESGDALAAIRMLGDTDVDVVLMDIRMPGIDGVEATRRIRATHPAPQLPILILTTFDQDEFRACGAPRGRRRVLQQGREPDRTHRRHPARRPRWTRPVADGGGRARGPRRRGSRRPRRSGR